MFIKSIFYSKNCKCKLGEVAKNYEIKSLVYRIVYNVVIRKDNISPYYLKSPEHHTLLIEETK